MNGSLDNNRCNESTIALSDMWLSYVQCISESRSLLDLAANFAEIADQALKLVTECMQGMNLKARGAIHIDHA